MKLRLPTILFFLISSIFSFGQKVINLIPNPSFEDVNICSKYSEACYPEAWRSSTLKAFYYLNDESSKDGKNKALDGHHFVSFCMHNVKRSFDRSFIQTQLLCELEAGKTYELSFYYKTPFRMLEQFGVHFTDTMIIKRKNDHLEDLSIDVLFENKNLIPANTWIEAKGVYKAKGGENVIMIGNFNSDERTRVIPIIEQKKETYSSLQSRTYYLFDHFKLIPLDTEIYCDIEKRRQVIYEDNVRHTFPKPKPEVVSESEAAIVETPEVIQPPEVLVIAEDSIIISETFELPDILFEFNSDRLLTVAYPPLRQLANYLLINRTYKLQITGHTDDVGSTLSNQLLSEERAKAVQTYLLRQGISPARISYLGKGESEPIDSNDSEAGRANNRRVEFQLRNEG